MHADPNQPASQPTYDPVARRVRDFRRDGLRRVHSPGQCHGRRQSRPGLPQFCGAGLCQGGGAGRRSQPTSTSTRAAPAIRAWSTRSPRSTARSSAACSTPCTEIVVTVGATEGIFATVQALVESGRRGHPHRALLRQLSGRGHHGRRHARLRAAARAGGQPQRRRVGAGLGRTGRCLHPAHQAHHAQHAAQPAGQGLQPQRVGGDCRASRRSTTSPC